MQKKIIITAVVIAIFAMIKSPVTVSADYRYDEFGIPMPAQASHASVATYNGKQLDIGNFKDPTDIFVDQNNLIYILDAGNNRIVILNRDYQVERVITEIKSNNGVESIEGANGLFVSNEEKIFIADTSNARILITDLYGKLLNIITRPESDMLPKEANFLPKSIIVDKTGNIYMISEKSTQGAYMMSPKGEFMGFYGRNNVTLTAELVFEHYYRKFASEAQREKMSNFIPVEFSNFDIDEEGFVYTVTAYSGNPINDEMIRKLNPLGNNILQYQWHTYGDAPDGDKYLTAYTDIAVDDNHFIYTLDSYTGRIFLYDDTGFQISIFGGAANQQGYFKDAIAIDTIGNDIIILDSAKKNITVFEPTYFGKTLIEAMSFYNEGKLEECLSLFEELIKMDANFFFAYKAIAMTYYDMGQYELAEKNAKISDIAQLVYSDAKKEIRNNLMRERFTLLFFGVILLCLIIIGITRMKKIKVLRMRMNNANASSNARRVS